MTPVVGRTCGCCGSEWELIALFDDPAEAAKFVADYEAAVARAQAAGSYGVHKPGYFKVADAADPDFLHNPTLPGLLDEYDYLNRFLEGSPT